MSRRPGNPARRLANGRGIPFMHSKSRSSPLLSIGLVIVGAILLIVYCYSGSGGVSCTLEVLPILKKAYGDSMHKVLHIGPETCSVVSKLLKEEDTEAWGVEPYDLDDVDAMCKRNLGQRRAKVVELSKFGHPAKFWSWSWWIRCFLQASLEENEAAAKKFEQGFTEDVIQAGLPGFPPQAIRLRFFGLIPCLFVLASWPTNHANGNLQNEHQ